MPKEAPTLLDALYKINIYYEGLLCLGLIYSKYRTRS